MGGFFDPDIGYAFFDGTRGEDCLFEMSDALMLLVDVVRNLRCECFCPDEERKDVLYYHGFKGAVIEAVNFNQDKG